MLDDSTISPYLDTIFVDAIYKQLRRNPSGISEYELIQQLKARGFFPFLDTAPAHTHALFTAHFLLFHALYRLRDKLWATGNAQVDINALNIKLAPYHKGQNALAEPDALREYYLDLDNLTSTSEVDVDDLITSFWARLSRQDQRGDALATLGLCDPVDDETIKHTYRRLVMEHHPDRGGDKDRLQAINAAINILLE